MRILTWVGLLLLVGALLLSGLFLLPYGPQKETFVEIAPGTSTRAIADELQRAGVVRSAAAFAILKAWRGGTLKAGEYRFNHAATVTEVYDRLRRGDVFTLVLVIPEGFNIFDIAEAVQGAGLGTRDAFLAAEMQHKELIRRWAPEATSLEGYLFPDTYRFDRHATPDQMLQAMVKRFARAMSSIGVNGTAVNRTVILASLVEKEVHLPSERPVAASVFENRLNAGMPLQTDPSVVYGSLLRGTWTGVIHQSELRSDSLYNTYTHRGLPPGPICNPGRSALEAVLHPAKTDYFYFVADAHGATRFARTIEEHNANVSSYRAADRSPSH